MGGTVERETGSDWLHCQCPESLCQADDNTQHIYMPLGVMPFCQPQNPEAAGLVGAHCKYVLLLLVNKELIGR